MAKQIAGHHYGESDRRQEIMQPAEAGVEAEQKTKHWRIPFCVQLATDCFPDDERDAVC